MILSHQSIRSRCRPVTGKPLIEPFTDDKVAFGGTTYGLGACSYDLRLGSEFAYQATAGGWVKFRTGTTPVWLARGDAILAHTVETLEMPDDLVAHVLNKSTLARWFTVHPTTLIDPGFRGQVTLEIINHSQRSVALVPGSGICQVQFAALDEPTCRPYAGRYQDQVGVTLPKEAQTHEP